MLYILKNDKPLWIKLNPNFNSRNIGIIKPGDLVSIDQITDDGWYKVLGGYVYGLDNKKNSLFETNINSVTSSDKLSKLPPKIRSRYYAGEVPDGDEEDIFPNETSTWESGSDKIVTRNLGDGTWIMVKINQDTDERYTYKYDKNGTKSTVKESAQVNGYRNSEQLNEDGTRVTVTYQDNAETGVRTKVQVTYNPDGSVASTNTLDIDRDSGTISASQAMDAIAEGGMNDLINASSGGDISSLTISDLYGIHGMPYQYMNIVDRCDLNYDSSSLGRHYAERIVARLPSSN